MAPKEKPLYNDRDYLEVRFGAIEHLLKDRLGLVIETLNKQTLQVEKLELKTDKNQFENNKRFNEIEVELYSAKLLGRAAIGVAVVIGGFITWSLDLFSKVAAILSR